MTYDRAKRSVCRAMLDNLRKNSLYNEFYELQRLRTLEWTEKKLLQFLKDFVLSVCSNA